MLTDCASSALKDKPSNGCNLLKRNEEKKTSAVIQLQVYSNFAAMVRSQSHDLTTLAVASVDLECDLESAEGKTKKHWTNAIEAIHRSERISPAYSVECLPETIHNPSVCRESLPHPSPN